MNGSAQHAAIVAIVPQPGAGEVSTPPRVDAPARGPTLQVKLFHSEDEPLASLEEQVNAWLAAERPLVRHVAQSATPGEAGVPVVTLSVWYERPEQRGEVGFRGFHR